ncbi:imidazole glycerol phosphate synthase subunit HisH [Celeribacter sp. SCSIO 80788]|uniref:imidazole glycerol phosphate synthase subunit HisH n=1 Tax=Celeribacter sp. SCSIO 80788 TaxID=3117013 RepID=UPI003DA47E41
MLTALVDYDSGNLHSAHKAFERMARERGEGTIVVTSEPDVVAKADRIVLPGDGAFPACKKQLFDYTGLFEAISEAVIDKGRPFMGICIGMQMLATRGLEYEETKGFDWIGGEVVKIEPSDPALKVPHMGWNNLHISNTHPVLDGVETGDHAYFVHSYHFKVANPVQRLAYVNYGEEVTAIVARDNIIGTQFHPEKSQRAGLRIVSNFLGWKP